MLRSNIWRSEQFNLFMKLRYALVLACAVVLGAASSLHAQFGGPGRGSALPGMNPALAKVFGKNNAFSAKVQMKITDASGTELMSGPATYAFLEGSTYWAMDMSEIKSAQMPPQAAAQMKAMGMAEMTTISKANAKSFLLVYPGMKAYVEMSSSSVSGANESADIKTEAAGEETVNGHKCKKNKVTIKDGGKTQELLTWNATDLKDFPVRVEFADTNNKVQMDYSDIKLEKPDAKLFEAPKDFTRYENVQQMLQTEMMKRMGAPK